MLDAPAGTILRLQEDLPLPGFQTRRIKAIYFQDGRHGRGTDRMRPQCGITFSDHESFAAIYSHQALPKGDYTLESTMRAPIIGAFHDSWSLRAPNAEFKMHLYCLSSDHAVTTEEMIGILGSGYAAVILSGN